MKHFACWTVGVRNISVLRKTGGTKHIPKKVHLWNINIFCPSLIFFHAPNKSPHKMFHRNRFVQWAKRLAMITTSFDDIFPILGQIMMHKVAQKWPFQCWFFIWLFMYCTTACLWPHIVAYSGALLVINLVNLCGSCLIYLSNVLSYLLSILVQLFVAHYVPAGKEITW